MGEGEHVADGGERAETQVFEGFWMRKTLLGNIGNFCKVSFGREYHLGTIESVQYGYVNIRIPPRDGKGKPHLAVLKVNRITGIELWEK